MDRRQAIASVMALVGSGATVKSFTVDKPTEFFVIEVPMDLIERGVEVDWETVKKVWHECFQSMGVPTPGLLGFLGMTLKKSTDLELFKLAADEVPASKEV